MVTRLAIVAVLALGSTQATYAAPQATASQAPESAIVAGVKRALSSQSDLRRLAVAADGSQVKLTGRVPTLSLKMEAVKRALKVEGVKTVLSGSTAARATPICGRSWTGHRREPFYTVCSTTSTW